MARTRTAEQIVQDILERTNMENSEFVTPEEVLEYYNQEQAELDWHLRRNEGQLHRRTSTPIAVTSGTVAYSLPTDFWELIGVSALIEGYNAFLDPFAENERAPLLNADILYPSERGPKYRIYGSQIEFLPSTKTFTATVAYVSRTARLRLGITPPDAIDGFNGYEMAPIYGACAHVVAKEEGDPTFWLGQKASILRMIDANAAQRDASHPERVTDIYGGLPSPWDI